MTPDLLREALDYARDQGKEIAFTESEVADLELKNARLRDRIQFLEASVAARDGALCVAGFCNAGLFEENHALARRLAKLEKSPRSKTKK